ncbi:MAG: ABC transporter permease subunit [Candidatus Bathyarchaeota archaeon]|jgi:ABC-2 type transport system permease protein
MASFMVICRKELSDHLGSKRFILLFGLILALSLFSAYQGAESIRENTSAVFISIFSGAYGGGYSFLNLMFMFGPLIGLALGFDAINRERSQGSLSVLLSQPIFRDSVINGKFLAGIGALSLLTVATIGIMSGVAIPLLGFGPGPDEILRIVLFTLLTILYLSVWLAIGILFSTLTKKTSTSMLMSISTWIFSAIVITIMASLIANALVSTQMPSGMFRIVPEGDNGSASLEPIDQTMMEEWQERMELNSEIRSLIQRFSPSILYQEAATSLITVNAPFFSSGSGVVVSYGSFGAEQDMLSNWPQIVVLAVVLIVCFAASYMLFLRQEIRAGS